MNDEGILISTHFGGEVKSLADNRVGGYLIRFGKPDLDGDYFTKDTDFGFDESLDSPVYLHHRQPLKTRAGGVVIVKDKIGKGRLTKDEQGILIDAILYNSEQFRKGLAVMGWSSGTAPHVVDRKRVGKSFEVTEWPLGLDASLTPKPCDPGNICSLKSYTESTADIFADDLIDLPDDAAPPGDDEMKSESNSVEIFSASALDALIPLAARENEQKYSEAMATAADEILARLEGMLQAIKAYHAYLNDKQEFRFTKDGRVLSRATLARITALLDRSKKLRGVHKELHSELEAIMKIAEMTKAQRELQDEEARYEFLLANQLLASLSIGD